MLLLNESMTATECWESGLGMEVFPSSEFAEDVRKKVLNLASMPAKVDYPTVIGYKCQEEQETKC